MRTFWATVPAIVFVVAAGIATAYPAGFDGTWQANGESVGRCGRSWSLRLTVAQGQASGSVTFTNGTEPLGNLVLKPDGTFTGVTVPTNNLYGRLMTQGNVSGKLSADTITVSFEGGGCGTREAKGTRLSQ